jgi:hypothetical protein
MPFDAFPLMALVFQMFLFPAFVFVAFPFVALPLGAFPLIALRVDWGGKDGLDGSFIHRHINILRGGLLQDRLLFLDFGLDLLRWNPSLYFLEYLLPHLFPHGQPLLFQAEPFPFRPEPLDLVQTDLFSPGNGWFLDARIVRIV